MKLSKKNLSTLKNHISPYLLNKIQNYKSYFKFLPYKKLLKINYELRDKHKNKRCFLLGSGKSIDLEDLNLLKDEIVISIHSLAYHPNFKDICNSNTAKYHFESPIHGPSEEEDWIKHFKDLDETIPNNVICLFGLDNYEPNSKSILEKNNLFNEKKIFWFFSNVINSSQSYRFCDSDLDMQSNIWTAKTGSICALICSLYMGFNEIYLLGMDHDYFMRDIGDARFDSIDKTKFSLKKEIEILETHKKQGINEAKLTNTFQQLSEIFEQYEKLNDLFPNRIYNLGRNSLLDMFPNRQFKNVLKKV